MSTRCHIIVEDKEFGTNTILYRHSDGYPDGPHGVLASLVPFVVRFLKNRGWDSCYLGAHIMADQIRVARESRRAYYQRCIDRAESEGKAPRKYDVEGMANVDNDFLGFGISNEVHGDVEFIYRVSPEGIDVEYPNGEKITTPAEARAMFEGAIPERYRESE